MGKINLSQKIKTNISPKQMFWVRLATTIGVIFTLYYGYCWGIWGRSSLLLRYLFQCTCPVSSTEFRYPKQIDVVLSACEYDSFILSPSGRFLYFDKRELGNNYGYFWDLQINEKSPYIIPEGYKYFLTDELLFLFVYYGKGVEGGEYILDRTTEIRYPIQSIETYTESKENINLILSRIRGSEKVFYIEGYNVIGLVENFQTHPENNFIVHYDIPGKTTDEKEKFLQENNITYTLIPRLAFNTEEEISPNGRFFARRDGIYLVETNQKIVSSHNGLETYTEYSGRNFLLYGWVSDSTGVIYAEPFGTCLISIFFLDHACLIEVHQPVLLLKVPQEYLNTP